MAKFVSSKTFDVQVRSLQSEWEYYGNFPSFQRGQVWPDTMKKMLIDSILRGYPIGEILGYEEDGRFHIIDGQQRLSTIYDFVTDGFNTISEIGLQQIEPQPIEVIEPGKRMSQLTADAAKQIRNYTLHFMQIDRRSDVELGVMFRRLQMEIPLSMGEKLASYSSRAKSIAIDLSHEPFFAAIYRGDNKHQQRFHMCLNLLEMARNGFPTNLQKRALSQLTSGRYDYQLTDEVVVGLRLHLKMMAHVFLEAPMKARTDIIAMYQAVIKLEQAGYDLLASRAGCLTKWFERAKNSPVYGKPWGNLNTFAQLTHTSIQGALWAKQERDLFNQPGLVKKQEQATKDA
jgi:hypothetical protein